MASPPHDALLPAGRNPLLPCGRPECRLCNPVPVNPASMVSIPEMLTAALAFLLLFVALFVLLPVLA